LIATTSALNSPSPSTLLTTRQRGSHRPAPTASEGTEQNRHAPPSFVPLTSYLAALMKSGSRFARWGAHLIQKLEDLYVRLQRATFSIRYRTLFAERSDDDLSPLQVVPRHAREQMVFDLVVQPAVPEVRQGVSLDIATGQHLAAHEVELALAVQSRHPLVVGGEHRPEVQTIQALMDQDKH